MHLAKLLLGLALAAWPIALAAQPTDPPPPVTVSGSTSSSYEFDEQTYREDGYLLVQIWTHEFVATDAKYVIRQAHLVLQPTNGDDIEDIQFVLPSPSNAGCRLIEWLPKLNSQGITLAGSANIDASPGVNIGAEGTVGVEGTQVTAGGPDANHHLGHEDAEWDLDFDDFSDTAAGRVTVDFYGYWRCPQDAFTSHLPPTICFEIDEWGWDPRYYLFKGFEYLDGELLYSDEYNLIRNLAPVTQQTARLDERGQALLIESFDNVAAIPGENLRLRARAYSRMPLDFVSASLEIAELAGASWPMEVSKVGKEAGLPFVELSARILVPNEIARLTPTVSAMFPGDIKKITVGAAVPVLVALGHNSSAAIKQGRNAFILQGTPGERFALSLPPSEALRTPPLLYKSVDRKSFLQEVKDGTSGEYLGRGSVLVVETQPDEEDLRVEVRDLRSDGLTVPILLAAALGAAIGGFLICWLIAKVRLGRN